MKDNRFFLFSLLILMLIGHREVLNGKDLKFSTLTIEDGLPYSMANTMFQDSNGFMWLGTHLGLCRYDGIQLQTYKEFDNKKINALIETDNQWLWVGMEHGLARMNLKTREVEPILFEGKQELKDVTSICWGKDGGVYVTCSSGLYVYKDNELLHKISSEGRLYAMCEDTPNQFWLVSSKGVLCFDAKSETTVRYPWSSGKLPYQFGSMSIFKNTLYVALEHNPMLRFHTKDHRFMTEFLEEDKNRTHPLVGEESRLYVNTSDGIEVVSCSTNQSLYTIAPDKESRNGLRSNAVYSLYKKNKLLWLSFFGGGLAYSPIENDAFDVYQWPSAGFTTQNRAVRSFYIAPNGTKLIGTREGLIYVSERDNKVHYFTSKEYSVLKSNIILFIYPFRGDYLIGTAEGVLLFSETSFSFRRFSDEKIYQSAEFYCCLQEDEDQIWFGTSEGLLCYQVASRQTIIYSPDNSALSSGTVFSLCSDLRGRLWIGTMNGVCVMDKATQKITVIPSSDKRLVNLLQGMISTIYHSKDNKLCFCTDRNGLIIVDERTMAFSVFSEDNILPSNTVASVFTDERGVYWIATYKGVLCYDPLTGKKQLYGISAGLPGSIFNNRFLLDEKGNYWWGNEMGLVICKPSNLQKASLCNIPLISSISVSGKKLRFVHDCERGEVAPEYAKSITLSASENSLEIGFSMRVFLGTVDTYEYMLEGVDEKWRYTQGENDISYDDLAPGTYLLHVRGQGNADYENCIRIIVEYPLYLWFAIVTGVLAIIGAFFYFYWKKKRVEAIESETVSNHETVIKDTEILAEVVPERQKVPRLAQEKLDNLHEALIAYFEKEKPYLNKQLRSSDVAAALSCSHTSLSQCLTFKLDMSFTDFVTNYRIKAFVQMLKDKDLSIYTLTSIAEQCGFNSKTSFFRSFKKQMGCTPVEYIQKYGQKIIADQ